MHKFINSIIDYFQASDFAGIFNQSEGQSETSESQTNNNSAPDSFLVRGPYNIFDCENFEVKTEYLDINHKDIIDLKKPISTNGYISLGSLVQQDESFPRLYIDGDENPVYLNLTLFPMLEEDPCIYKSYDPKATCYLGEKNGDDFSFYNSDISPAPEEVDLDAIWDALFDVGLPGQPKNVRLADVLLDMLGWPEDNRPVWVNQNQSYRIAEELKKACWVKRSCFYRTYRGFLTTEYDDFLGKPSKLNYNQNVTPTAQSKNLSVSSKFNLFKHSYSYSTSNTGSNDVQGANSSLYELKNFKDEDNLITTDLNSSGYEEVYPSGCHFSSPFNAYINSSSIDLPLGNWQMSSGTKSSLINQYYTETQLPRDRSIFLSSRIRNFAGINSNIACSIDTVNEITALYKNTHILYPKRINWTVNPGPDAKTYASIFLVAPRMPNTYRNVFYDNQVFFNFETSGVVPFWCFGEYQSFKK